MPTIVSLFIRAASGPFHHLKAILVTDSSDLFALLCFFPGPNKAFIFSLQNSSVSEVPSPEAQVLLPDNITKDGIFFFWFSFQIPKPTSVHHAEPDRPYQTIDIRWVLHLAGVRPIVIELQLPEDDGDIVPSRVPIPDHPVLEPSTHGTEGIRVVVKHLQRAEDEISHSVRGRRQI